ncbi:hypothetical protein CRUP_030395 [Coryphaenoides rupestris]|nr:hypothetical protein CRUP_030395 [Coryphaenoides rupestris]
MPTPPSQTPGASPPAPPSQHAPLQHPVESERHPACRTPGGPRLQEQRCSGRSPPPSAAPGLCRPPQGGAAGQEVLLHMTGSGGGGGTSTQAPPPSRTGSPGVLTAQCVDLLLRLRPAVRSSWRPIRQAFATYDPDRIGRIPMRDFRKVLRRFRLSLTDEETFHLACYFDAGALGTVGYNHFLRAYLH